METYTWEDVRDVRVGEVFTLNNKRYKLTKKGTTAIAARPWHWWDSLWQKLTEGKCR